MSRDGTGLNGIWTIRPTSHPTVIKQDGIGTGLTKKIFYPVPSRQISGRNQDGFGICVFYAHP